MFKTRLTTSTITSLLIALLPYIICGGLAPVVIDYDVRPLIPYLAAYTDMQMLYGVSVILSMMGFGLALYGFDRIRNSYDTTTKIVQAVAVASVLGFLAYYAYESYPHYKNTPFAWTKAYFYFMGEITFIFILPVVVTGVMVVGEMVYRLQNLKPVEQNPFGNASLLSSSEAEHKSNPEGLPLGRVLKGLQGNETDLIGRIKSSRSGSIFRCNPIHSFLFAPTGSGKGVGFVIPTLLDYDGPVVCIDPKSAENFKITSKYRQTMNEKGKNNNADSLKKTTYVFDTNDLVDQKSDCFNVFDFLDPEERVFQDTLKSFVYSLCPTGEDSRENFFIEAAQDIILCAFLICFTLPKEEQNLMSVYALLMKNSDDFENMLKGYAIDHSFDGLLSRNVNKILSTDSRELSGCLNTARRHLKFVDSTFYRDICRDTTIDFNKIANNEADLFFCIPTKEIVSHGNGFVRLVLSVLIHETKKRTEPPEKDILIILDEMAGIGRFDLVEDVLLEGRAFGLKIIGIAQTIASLKKVYFREIDTILSSSLLMFMEVTTPENLTYVGQKLGSKTVFTESDSKSKQNRSDSQTTSVAKRDLLTTDEINRLYDDYVIVFATRQRPLILQKIRYYEDSRYKKLVSK